MGFAIRFFDPLLKSLFTVLLFLLLAYPATGAEDPVQDKAESADSAQAEKSPNQQSKTYADTDSQEDASINGKNPSNHPSGAEDLSLMPDASVEKAEVAPDTEKNSPEQPVYPGVRNDSIIRDSANGPSLEIYYPVFGNQAVDAAIKLYAEKQAAEYEKDVAESVSSGEERPNGYEQWEMSGYFNLERPGPDIVSIIFNIFSYSGGAHGNLVINCLNYNLKSGKPVDFADLFRDPEKALEMMSAFSAKKLSAELGDYADEDMILSGTSPDLANFSNLTLVPGGLYIEFQPYQVGPWAAGPQRVEMTLQDLAAAGPEPDIWPGAIDLPTPPAADTVNGESPDSPAPDGQN